MLTSSHQSIRVPYNSSTTVAAITDGMINDDVLSDEPSSPDSTFDASELMQHDVHHDDVTNHLAASGTLTRMLPLADSSMCTSLDYSVCYNRKSI